MTVRNQVDSLKQRIIGAVGIPALLQVLDDIGRLESEHGHSDDIDDLRLDAFHALATLTQNSPSEAEPIMIQRLLPLCLRARGEWGVPHPVRRYDEALSAWLDSFSTTQRFALRAAVLHALVESLTGPTPAKACRLIGMLSYRDDRAFTRLLNLAQVGDNAIRRISLGTLVTLGVPPSNRDSLVRFWLELASADPWDFDLLGAAKLLASPEILDFILDRWLTAQNLRDSDDNRKTMMLHLAIAIPATIAEQFPSDIELQDRVWNRLRDLERMALLRYRT